MEEESVHLNSLNVAQEDATLPPLNPKKKRKGKPSSDIWNHFTKDESRDKDDPRASCNYCGTNFACHAKRNGTSSMKYHLTRCIKYPYRVSDKKQKTLSFDRRDSVGSCNLVSWKFDKGDARGKLARMLIIDELPFSFVEGEGFIDFCHSLCPDFEPLSRRTICRDVINLYSSQKEILKDLLANGAQSVCLTTDTWTSIQNINYMTLTAHFIDNDWKLHKRILNFCVITNHKGESIGKLIVNCIREWGLKRIFTITVDNASANDVAVNYVKKVLKDDNGCVLDGEFMHMRCCAHIVNLIVSDGLKEIQSSIACVRNAVRYVRSSPSRLHKFKETIKRLNIDSKSMLALDVSTRWNSTYMMLESALTYQRVFENMEEEDGHYVGYFNEDDGGKRKVGPPKLVDWDNAKVFVKFFRAFYEITLKFSCTLSVTSNTCFTELSSIEEELNQLSHSDDVFLRKMATSMKQKYDKYWGSVSNMNKILIVACVLDPRYKMQFVSLCYEEMFDVSVLELEIKQVKEVLIRLFEWYKGIYSIVEGQCTNDESSCDVIINDGSSGSKTTSIFGGSDSRMNKFMKKVQQQDNECNEIEKYLNESVEVAKPNFNVLNWWKVNSTKYRVLSLIARDVFAIPVSTVASESAFSTGGRILEPFRSCLSPRMVEALVTTQNWLRSKPIFVDHRIEMPFDDVDFYDEVMSDLTSCLTTEGNISK